MDVGAVEEVKACCLETALCVVLAIAGQLVGCVIEIGHCVLFGTANRRRSVRLEVLVSMDSLQMPLTGFGVYATQWRMPTHWFTRSMMMYPLNCVFERGKM